MTVRFTHIVTFNTGATAIAVTGREAVSTRKSQRDGYRPDVDKIHTRARVEREYESADRAVTYWYKRTRLQDVRGLYHSADYSNDMLLDAQCRLDEWTELLVILDRAEQNVKVV